VFHHLAADAGKPRREIIRYTMNSRTKMPRSGRANSTRSCKRENGKVTVPNFIDVVSISGSSTIPNIAPY
jgi:hypothetical protein